MRKNYSKTKSLIIILIIYIIAALVGYAAYKLLESLGPLWAVLIADATATVIVWAAGLYFLNPSVYDPYWSVTPMIVIPFWMIVTKSMFNLSHALLLIAVLFWGIRLTMNWVLSWRGMNHCDWRYDMLKEKNPKLWPLTNFFGINMIPTVFVFFAMIPAYYFIESQNTLSIYTAAGFFVCMSAVFIQITSDRQMTEHRLKGTGLPIDMGLWRYSRHPNYFGEVAFWWGIFIMSNAVSDAPLARIYGALLMTALFIFISIPMMERHVLKKYPEYAEYKSKVSMLLPWFRKD